MKLLAIDCSSHVGWCFFASPGSVPLTGTEKIPKSWNPEDYGGRGKYFHDWLCDMITVHDPDVLAFEGPFLPQGSSANSTTEHTLRFLVGLAMLAEVIATIREIKVYEVNVATAKKRLTGNGRAEKRDMVVAATRLGFPVADDHQADAIAVALVVYDLLADQ